MEVATVILIKEKRNEGPCSNVKALGLGHGDMKRKTMTVGDQAQPTRKSD
jgi:hypothetical protein